MRITHSMELPDWMWKVAIDLSGLRNPAPWIRDDIIAIALTDSDFIESFSENNQERSEIRASGSVDSGTAIIAKRPGLCRECGALIEPGDTIVMRTINGRKGTFCKDHFNRPGRS